MPTPASCHRCHTVRPGAAPPWLGCEGRHPRAGCRWRWCATNRPRWGCRVPAPRRARPCGSGAPCLAASGHAGSCSGQGDSQGGWQGGAQQARGAQGGNRMRGRGVHRAPINHEPTSALGAGRAQSDPCHSHGLNPSMQRACVHAASLRAPLQKAVDGAPPRAWCAPAAQKQGAPFN